MCQEKLKGTISQLAYHLPCLPGSNKATKSKKKKVDHRNVGAIPIVDSILPIVRRARARRLLCRCGVGSSFDLARLFLLLRLLSGRLLLFLGLYFLRRRRRRGGRCVCRRRSLLGLVRRLALPVDDLGLLPSAGGTGTVGGARRNCRMYVFWFRRGYARREGGRYKGGCFSQPYIVVLPV